MPEAVEVEPLSPEDSLAEIERKKKILEQMNKKKRDLLAKTIAEVL